MEKVHLSLHFPLTAGVGAVHWALVSESGQMAVLVAAVPVLVEKLILVELQHLDKATTVPAATLLISVAVAVVVLVQLERNQLRLIKVAQAV
jgi:hypothetical protein